MSPSDRALAGAWQAALAAEQRAAFGYGVLGPQLAGADQRFAISCSNAHEDLRDATAPAIAAAGLTPVEPQADYPDLYPVPDAAAARALATRLEDGCARAWRYLYLQAAAPQATTAARRLRPAAQQALTASAVRAVQWRTRSASATPSTPFPGT
jgi:hypothetical protein